MQAHVKLPGVLVQVASAWQLSVARVHSLSSVQSTPLPVKPVLQAQEKLPSVFVQRASAWQLWPSPSPEHSSESTQPVPPEESLMSLLVTRFLWIQPRRPRKESLDRRLSACRRFDFHDQRDGSFVNRVRMIGRGRLEQRRTGSAFVALSVQLLAVAP